MEGAMSEETTWSNVKATPDPAPLTLEEMAALVKQFDDPRIPWTVEVGDQETLDWMAAALQSREEPEGQILRTMGLSVSVDERLGPRAILFRNRKGEPIRFFVRAEEGKLLMLDLSQTRGPYGKSLAEIAAVRRWEDSDGEG
jgi:hypothetical protein